MTQKDLLHLLLLVLAVVIGVQFVRFHVQIDSVEKTVASLIPDWHSQGEDSFRERLIHELALLGVDVSQDDLLTEGRVLEDKILVELHYDWPLDVLVWELPREHVFELEAPYFEL